MHYLNHKFQIYCLISLAYRLSLRFEKRQGTTDGKRAFLKFLRALFGFLKVLPIFKSQDVFKTSQWVSFHYASNFFLNTNWSRGKKGTIFLMRGKKRFFFFLLQKDRQGAASSRNCLREIRNIKQMALKWLLNIICI